MEENRFKQRMIGAIVLIALGVIFLPMLLNGESDDGMPLFGSNIPERHKSITQMTPIDVTGVSSPPQEQAQRRELVDKKSVEIEPKIPLVVQGMQQVPELNKPQNKISVTEQAAYDNPKKILAAEKPQQIAALETKAWVVQVGSFTTKKNALLLQNKLRKKKFNAFIEKITTASGIRYRVRIGPQINRKKAEKINLLLKKKIKKIGLVMTYPG